jgi:hypothetical protein
MYSKTKLESIGDRPYWVGKLTDECLPIWTLLYKHILIILADFMGIVLSSSLNQAFMKSMNSLCNVSL